MDDLILPSWRPGATRDAVLGFLDAVLDVPEEDRIACFDNDGTLWCERPNYVQYDFFIDALKVRAAETDVTGVPEFAALLNHDAAAVGELGLERIALALTSLFEGIPAEEFRDRVRDFMARSQHPTLARPPGDLVYQPMIELIDELRRRDVAVTIVTGGGTEFVRAISHQLYGVPPEAVVGTLIDYEYSRDDNGAPRLRRTGSLDGAANEGTVKVSNIQRQLGRRPLLAAGNSGGDREMLEWAAAGDGPTLALLVDHDDGDREFSYASKAASFEEAEPVRDVGIRLGWTVVSMASDWATVFRPV
ncbi:HAD family hydrolase [Nocardioides sp. HM23]|uniref:HAD family hydrolase n=1 Tax=Nocardioides bizhenqiangii TaxID=3095076 RepID=UPI002ACAD1FB|nr:HAD family hydrolase [Nocardioides sp. HM23]MDZ5623033.1 HAD family hydrolase [Nocardioides sp. HM23]